MYELLHFRLCIVNRQSLVEQLLRYVVGDRSLVVCVSIRHDHRAQTLIDLLQILLVASYTGQKSCLRRR